MLSYFERISKKLKYSLQLETEINMKELALIILNWNGTNDTIECIQSISKNKMSNYDVYVLDNGSNTEEFTLLKKWYSDNYQQDVYALEDYTSNVVLKDNVIMLYSKSNLGFSKGNNEVAKRIFNDYENILFLNNDTVIDPTCLEKMVNTLNENLSCGYASCLINYYSQRSKLWSGGGKFTVYGDRKYYSVNKLNKCKRENKYIEAPFITGCALIVKSDILKKYGFFTEDFFFGEEDFNFCKRLNRENIKGQVLLDVLVYHKASVSIEKIGKNTVGKTVVHFCNRIIDQKKFYPKIYWRIWRVMYIEMVILKCRKWGYKKELIKRMKELIRSITRENDQITRDLFFSIINQF